VTTIGVVGLGLIGGSVALAADRAGHHVVAWDIDAASRDQATAAGIPVSADLSAAQVVVLALPLPALTGELTTTLAGVQISDTATITDVGSVKQPVVAAMAAAGLARRYVAGHPMAGTEQAGFRAAIAELFTDARWVLCPPEAGGLERWLDVAALAISLGANIFPLSAGEHDRAMGLISGLPHLLALGLEAAVAHGPGYLPALTAGSFADLTRVAGSAPHLLRAVTESNKESVRVALQQLLDQLGGSWDALIDEGHRAHLSRAAAVGAGFPDATKPDTVAVPGAAELLAMGRSGRYVISLDIDRRTMTLSAAAES